MTDPQLPDVEKFIDEHDHGMRILYPDDVRTLAAQYQSVIDAQAEEIERLRGMVAQQEMIDAEAAAYCPHGFLTGCQTCMDRGTPQPSQQQAGCKCHLDNRNICGKFQESRMQPSCTHCAHDRDCHTKGATND